MEQRYAALPESTLAQRLTDRLYLLIVRRDVDYVEVTSGILLLGWGVQLLLPWETFRTGISYMVLASIMPERAWGALMACLGVAKVGAYLLDHRRVRLAVSLLACMVWTFLSVAFGVANPASTGLVVYPFLATLSALLFWRILTSRAEPGCPTR